MYILKPLSKLNFGIFKMLTGSVSWPTAFGRSRPGCHDEMGQHCLPGNPRNGRQAGGTKLATQAGAVHDL